MKPLLIAAGIILLLSLIYTGYIVGYSVAKQEQNVAPKPLQVQPKLKNVNEGADSIYPAGSHPWPH